MNSLHHTMLPNYIKEMKKYHLAHHYKNFELGYGVTSQLFSMQPSHRSNILHSFPGKIWDIVFNTVIPV